MKREVFGRIRSLLILTETLSLLITCAVVISLEIYAFKNKSKILLDTLRNDYIAGDHRELNQKMQVAISQHEFVMLEFVDGPSLSKNLNKLEAEFFDFSADFPVLANTTDSGSQISTFRTRLSLVKPLVVSISIWLLVTAIVFLSIPLIKRRIAAEMSRKYELIQRNYEYKVARQVAHDIRSPLSALRIGVDKIADACEVKDLILNSCDRISKIADDLLQSSKSTNCQEKKYSAVGGFCLVSATKEIVAEKRISDEVHIGINSFDVNMKVFACGDRQDFQRAISNIIDNSIDALGLSSNGKIDIFFRHVGDIFSVTVVDNGPGIPDEIKGNICSEGITFGKKGGTGIGLYHAKSVLESMGGKLEILSKRGEGTLVSAHVPILR